MAVSPLTNVVISPTQSVAVPHPASLAAVFKEIMDAAEMNQLLSLQWMKLKPSISIGRWH